MTRFLEANYLLLRQMRAAGATLSVLLKGQFISNQLQVIWTFWLFLLLYIGSFHRVSLGCSLELTADCIRDSMWCFTCHSLHFVEPLCSPSISMCILPPPSPFLSSTKANCSSVFLPLFHPSVFSLFLSVSFCPFHNNEHHLFCLFFINDAPSAFSTSEQPRPVLLFSSNLIKQGKEQDGVCVAYNWSSCVPI